MRPRRWPIAVCLLLALIFSSLRCDDLAFDLLGSPARVLPGGFLVRPYLQLGDAPSPGCLRVLWQTQDVGDNWVLDYRPGPGQPWRTAEPPTWRTIAVRRIPAHRVYRTDVTGLEPGATFAYRLQRQGEVVFEAEGRAPTAAGQPQRFAVFGDCGAGSPEEKQIAERAYRERPDLVLIPGDIVYTRGRIREYRDRFWPVYDADATSPTTGAPLLRSIPFVAAPGNHDIAVRDLGAYPDGLAYFYYWDQPLNGPVDRDGASLIPLPIGPAPDVDAFRRAAEPAFPRMTSFSFDHGNVHWTVLDSNPYLDWTAPDLRGWLERDLAVAKDAGWRFVMMHHPPFNSSRAHFGDQRMRLLAETFEAGGVDVVWAGHVHNYQRTYPLTFVPNRGPDGRPARKADTIPGTWTLDRDYDGQTHTQPRGIIYVITGGGGADLYYPSQEDDPASWQPFTRKLIARVHSLSVADVEGRTLTVRQLAADGREVDRFVVTKTPPSAAGPGS